MFNQIKNPQFVKGQGRYMPHTGVSCVRAGAAGDLFLVTYAISKYRFC